MGTWHVDCEDEASMAEDMKCQTGCSRRGHDLCWVRSQDRSNGRLVHFGLYFQPGACILFPPASDLSVSSLGGCHCLLHASSPAHSEFLRCDSRTYSALEGLTAVDVRAQFSNW